MSREIVKCKTDVVFKKLFTENFDVLKSFLSDILEIPYESITDIVIENSEILPDEMDGKFTRFDMKLTVDDKLVNVEMQVINHGDFRERSLYYWAQRYGRQLKKGQLYTELHPTISINIVNFSMFKAKSYCSEYTMANLETGEILTNKCKMYFFELPKLDKTYDANDRKKSWMQLINSESEEELDMLTQQTAAPGIQRGAIILREYSEDEMLRRMSERSEERLRNELSAMQYWKTEGFTLGRAEGRAEGEAKGRAEGEIKGIINTYREFGISEQDALQKLMKKTGLPENAALEKLRLYW